jgi:hypothetical protein
VGARSLLTAAFCEAFGRRRKGLIAIGRLSRRPLNDDETATQWIVGIKSPMQPGTGRGQEPVTPPRLWTFVNSVYAREAE